MTNLILQESAESTEQIAAEISAKIELLNSISGENLKGEMQALKRTLLANPAACLLLKDEDVGSLVASLRRVTGVALSAASAAKTSKRAPATKAKKLTQEELQAAMNSDEF